MKRAALCFLLLVIGVSPAMTRDFWSPREIVLDTYEKAIPFRMGDATCLAYGLHITNIDKYPISVKKVEVYIPSSSSPYKVYAGDLLRKSLSHIGVPGGIDGDYIVNKGQRAILHFLLEFKDKDDVPGELSHRVVYSFLREEGSEVEATTRGGGIDVAVDAEALIIGPPLGDGV